MCQRTTLQDASLINSYSVIRIILYLPSNGICSVYKTFNATIQDKDFPEILHRSPFTPFLRKLKAFPFPRTYVNVCYVLCIYRASRDEKYEQYKKTIPPFVSVFVVVSLYDFLVSATEFNKTHIKPPAYMRLRRIYQRTGAHPSRTIFFQRSSTFICTRSF